MDVAKAAPQKLSSELLEQIYQEIEARIERKFEDRIASLEAKLRKAEAEREQWRTRFFKERERAEWLEGQLALAQEKIRELESTIERQRAQIERLQQQVHGKKNESSQPEPQPDPAPKRARGRQSGTKGHGRKKRTSLEPEDCVHKFQPQDLICSDCSLPFEEISEKTSEEIHFEYKLVRRIHRRQVVRKTCRCPHTPKIKTAPAPPKLFKGSLLSTELWSFVIFDKYKLQRPINRTRQLFESLGLSISQGTITNGLKRLHDNRVFAPLVEEIRSRVSSAKHQQKDETGWKVFQEVEGKKGYGSYLWVTLGQDCTLFQIEPSRSRSVAKQTIGEDPVVLSTDCFGAYKNMGDNVTNAWCWAHIRRALFELKRFPGLAAMAKSWVQKVDLLFHLNHVRLAAPPEQFPEHDDTLRAAVSEFERQAKRNASRVGMHPEALKVFRSIARHWDGLTVFVRLPNIPMDNNASERALRNAVVGRKCYYGSGSLWSAQLTADLFTLIATLDQNAINTRVWLNEYLHAVARNGGKAPQDALSFLPWNRPPTEELLS